VLYVDDPRFLPVKLQIRAILECNNMRDQRLALQNTPADLFDTYATTLKRIKQQPAATAQQALDTLMWIYLAPTPLQVVELQYALAIRPGDNRFDPEGISSTKTLVECCLGLVVVETETSTTRLTHFTLDEYFDEHWKNSDLFPDGHSIIAATCLSYIQFDHRFLPPELPFLFERQECLAELKLSSPLIQYSVNNLGHHLKMSSDRTLARRCITMLEQKEKFRLLELSVENSLNTTLHWAASFGCTLVAELLITH
jgi:hypothetical protein